MCSSLSWHLARLQELISTLHSYYSGCRGSCGRSSYCFLTRDAVQNSGQQASIPVSDSCLTLTASTSCVVYVAWSLPIVKQLDVGHRRQFSLIFTNNCACNMKVVTLLRQRGLENILTQLQKKISEQHNESWLRRVARYLTDCQTFVDANIRKRKLWPSPSFPVPQTSLRCQEQVASKHLRRNVMSSLGSMKASITSTFGKVLNVVFTKKVCRLTRYFNFGEGGVINLFIFFKFIFFFKL